MVSYKLFYFSKFIIFFYFDFVKCGGSILVYPSDLYYEQTSLAFSPIVGIKSYYPGPKLYPLFYKIPVFMRKLAALFPLKEPGNV